MGSDADLGAGLGGLGAGHGIGVNRGRGVSIMASVAGGCTEEENGERWLDNMVSSFRIMRSSFKSMEAWVAAKRRVQNPWTLGLWRGWPWRPRGGPGWWRNVRHQPLKGSRERAGRTNCYKLSLHYQTKLQLRLLNFLVAFISLIMGIYSDVH